MVVCSMAIVLPGMVGDSSVTVLLRPATATVVAVGARRARTAGRRSRGAGDPVPRSAEHRLQRRPRRAAQSGIAEPVGALAPYRAGLRRQGAPIAGLARHPPQLARARGPV